MLGRAAFFAALRRLRAACRRRTVTFTHSFEKLVAEKKIFIAMLTEHDAGQTQGRTRLDGAGIELPEIRCKKPGPA